ncbi:MAG: endonuclease/exonuclease/phosphatase family protein [Bacteriovorax sp.]|nr:endonuclease/exonuclease/phosphatase family protein [Bacteriovorax sp.]
MKTISQISKTLGLTILLTMGLAFSGSSQARDRLSHPVPSEKDVILKFGFPSQTSLTNRINFLVWNLHKGANDTFSTDYVSLAYQKDIVLAQEMYLTPLMQGVFDSFPQYFYTTATSFFFGRVLTRTGVATSSPVEPASIDYIRTETLEPVVNSPKVTLITRFPIRNSTKLLTVVNIHGINFVDGPAYHKEMNRIADVLKNIPSPIIFAGDFNSWNDDRLSILKEMSKKLKLNEASFSPDYRMTFNKHPLDHFFYTNDIKIISAKVEDFYQGSDHKPLEVVVEYSPPISFRIKH